MILSPPRPGWSCTCEDHQFRRVCGMHIHVEISLNIHQKVKDDVVISEIKIDSCTAYTSTNIKKAGIRKNKSGNIQMFKCRDCHKKFSINLGFENMGATPEQITMFRDIKQKVKKVPTTLISDGAANFHHA